MMFTFSAGALSVTLMAGCVLMASPVGGGSYPLGAACFGLTAIAIAFIGGREGSS